jgi:2-polyprenyl-3-methyl-5-hydroxy-6-metoxy-1,4-benzoquinol methylase
VANGTCPACGAAALEPWRDAPAAEPGLAPVALRRCSACGTAVTDAPVPAQDLHEEGAYRAGAPRLSRAAAPVLRAFDRRRLKLLGAVSPPPARLLDAGAGRGRFVAAARDAGYDATGIEPSARGVDGARETYGVALERAGIEDAAVGHASLDAVSLWHVLEHLDDPGAALDRVASWLRPGGTLLVGVPNLASLQARVGGARWYHLDLPRHRTHFTPAGLSALLEAHGFEVVAEHHVLAEHNPFGMWQSLVSRATRRPSYLYNLLKRNAPLRSPDLVVTVLALPLAPLAAVAELLAGVARRGGTVAVVARRAAG